MASHTLADRCSLLNTAPDTVAAAARSLVADTHNSLNFDNLELKRILPWTGTSRGPHAFIDTFSFLPRLGAAEAAIARQNLVQKEIRMTTYTVGYFVGSLSSTSINRQLAKALVRLAPPELSMTEIPIRDLPLYSQDYDADFPPVARKLKEAIANVDSVLFVTPEYNRSIPGGLKNAIDWASRPWGQNSFARKPSGVIGTSPGAIGTAVAQQSLRGVLCFCNSPLMNNVEAYVQFKPGLITPEGEVTDETTAEFLRNYMTELHAFIVRVLTVLPRNP